VQRARKLQRFFSQPMYMAEAFTNQPGCYVKIDESIRGVRAIVEGKHDDMPEQSFYMVGTLDDAIEKAKQLKVGV